MTNGEAHSVGEEIPPAKMPALLTSYLESGAPAALLFLGPPGIGKTAAIADTALELARRHGKILVDLTGDVCRGKRGENIVCPTGQHELVKLYQEVEKNPDKYFVYLRLVAPQVTPEDLQYPRPVGDTAIANMMPIKLAFLAVPGVEGLLFIDEITNVRREDAKTMLFALVNERTLGLGGQLSSNVLVVAAGNPPEVSSAAELLPAPLINRFTVINVRPPTVGEFIDLYERKCSGCAEEVPAFLLVMAAQGENLVYQPPAAEETNENYPTPRTWFRLGQLLHHIPDDLKLPVIIGMLGRRVGSMFYAFLKVRPPRPEELLENPGMYKSLDTEKRLMSLVYLARHVANHADNDTLSKYARFVADNFDDYEEEQLLGMSWVLRRVKDSDAKRRIVVMAMNAVGNEKFMAVLDKIHKYTMLMKELRKKDNQAA